MVGDFERGLIGKTAAGKLPCNLAVYRTLICDYRRPLPPALAPFGHLLRHPTFSLASTELGFPSCPPNPPPAAWVRRGPFPSSAIAPAPRPSRSSAAVEFVSMAPGPAIRNRPFAWSGTVSRSTA